MCVYVAFYVLGFELAIKTATVVKVSYMVFGTFALGKVLGTNVWRREVHVHVFVNSLERRDLTNAVWRSCQFELTILFQIRLRPVLYLFYNYF